MVRDNLPPTTSVQQTIRSTLRSLQRPGILHPNPHRRRTRWKEVIGAWGRGVRGGRFVSLGAELRGWEADGCGEGESEMGRTGGANPALHAPARCGDTDLNAGRDY